MRFGRLVKTVLVGMTVLLWMASASAQQVRFFPGFFVRCQFADERSAHQATYNKAQRYSVLRMDIRVSEPPILRPRRLVWLPTSVDVDLGRQSVNTGFTTYFKFQIDTAAICCTPADGFAFVIQNSSADCLGHGAGREPDCGYAGIPNSLAIEFDTYQNVLFGSQRQSCGSAELRHRSQRLRASGTSHRRHHIGTGCLVGAGINSSSSIPHLGVTCGTSGPCSDGVTHEVVIEYTPPISGIGNGTLKVWIDPPFVTGTHTPVPGSCACHQYPVQHQEHTKLPGNFAHRRQRRRGWASRPPRRPIPQAHDILAWEFTPHTAARGATGYSSGWDHGGYVSAAMIQR